jgi:translocation and assembly module TamB
MRRFAFLLVWLIELLLVTTGVMLLAAWIWSGTDGSLATAIRQAQTFLPAGQTIEAEDISGAIRSSGRIGSLRWQADGLSVHARDLRFSWKPGDLLQRRLHFGSLAIAEVEIDDQRPATEPQTPQPPPEVLLPIALDLPFSVDRLRLQGATALEVTDIAGRYQFGDRRHQLQLDSIAVAQGKYSGHLSLQAQAPMTLDLQLHGTVTAPVAQGQSITLDASATLRGPLAGTNASLDLLAQLQPAPGAGGALAQARAMRASVSAQISPWAAQPVARAQASFNQLDLAALWPSAPRTLLTGNAWVRPVGSNWLIDFNLINRAAGPWDKGQLPLDSAKGLVQLADKQWSIESLHAEAAGGRIRLQGALADPSKASATSGWQGQLQIQGVDPARLHTQMESVQLDGELSARAINDGVDFDATLQPAKQQARASALSGMRLRDAAASGRWAGGWLRVDKLHIRTADASVDGRVDVEIASKTARPELRLVAPGLLADLSGQIGALDGNGDLALKLSDASETRAWLARLPQMPDVVDAFDLQGNADLKLHWTGGWEALQGGRGAIPSLEARLQVPRLAIRQSKQAADSTLRISAVDAQISGKLDALTVSLRGNATRASQRLQLDTSATGGRDARGDWKATLRSLQLQAQDSQLPGPWSLVLAQPLTVSFASTTGDLRVGAAQAQLTGPEPGVATLAWEPIRWQQRSGSASLVSKGELRGLPMGWVTLLANADLNAAGLSGNLLFDGQWDITLANQLVARATLARRSGDIRIQADGAAPSGVGVTTSTNATVNAGIRELQLQLRADGDTVKADFRWDSERAGNAQAALSTRLTRSNDGWSWSPDSPLEATVRANMPQVGVWSLLAPPGWRVRGTVDANLNLTGTRRAPQWSGSLLASEMAVRSVVDGIEFGNGRLRATLQGQRLNIDAFSLQGAGGTSGGELTATGFATWTPATGAQASALDAIRLQIDAQANALRVSARADRRLAVSGTLQALLDKAKLQIRGALSVDQALFILPDETAPSLGSDVVVLRKGQTRPSDAASPAPVTKVADTRPNSAPGSTLEADLLVTLDLGQDFQVRGRGIDTRVAGELTLRSKLKPGESPTVTGELRTVGGQFRAYGQQLEIERGVMRFSGAYDNPSLNILAIRPKLTQRVGVQITGSALLPRVRLYAEPDLPEAEKLAWLVLGRSGANGGAEAAVLQQAAMALLGGQNSSGGFAGRLGLDEISLGGATEGGATSATVTLGKRISQNFYVAYESSLAGALGTFSIFYDLSERFTLRARTGGKSAVDLIFKYSYD